jgi:hypothetical protein
MKQFRATVIADRYPMVYTVEASSWSTAASRATKLWQQRFKGSRSQTLTIKITKGVV